MGKTTSKQTIGIVLSSPPGYSETFFHNKIKFLQEEGFEVRLFVDNDNGQFRQCRVHTGFSLNTTRKNKITVFLKTTIRLLININQAFKLWNLNKADGFSNNNNLRSILGSAHILGKKLDWIHFGFATTALNGENVARVIGAKMAVSVRGYDICIYPLKNPSCYDLLWKRMDKLHYISDDLFGVSKKLGFNQTKPSMKITPAIDINRFNNEENVAKKNIPNDCLHLTTIARLHWKKGLDYTLEALAKLADKGVDFRYTIIGDGQEYERLKFTTHQLNLTEKVVFIGKLSPEEVKQELNDTDVYVQYSIQEGFCNAVLEAQAMGCLCVVSDAEGLSENVLHDVTGYVVEKRNSEALAKKLMEVINLPEKDKGAMRQNAIRRVREEFNLESQKQKFLKFYSN